MKFKIECDSPLLQYALEKFLKEYLDENGVVITDNPEKDGILIGREITKPFSKTTLLLQLEKYVPVVSQKESFEEKLDKIFENFKTEIKNLIKEYYGEK
ncbi:hypothetical protein [Caminibacter pacificus]|uniref:Uncharacterized protein n=1 Tax=Caminibacter pacificus TaxID=1424653 RepID=A0AAJ4RCQ3_9BACT|nr:hypothetical protein [Caminibacter pacificus]NPA88219.1 hypothetical protein [Campylobacterota bacterium]QCI27819.1 hypothetical protein C6V80_02210 [Caminibacter pacificus]ROR40006.1 hypothetical protein EDC58_0986 [Caminibacter pacificus]